MVQNNLSSPRQKSKSTLHVLVIKHLSVMYVLNQFYGVIMTLSLPNYFIVVNNDTYNWSLNCMQHRKS